MCSMKNERRTMEDRCFTQELNLSCAHFLIYGVADGHSGEEVSNFLQHFIPSNIKKKIIQNENFFNNQKILKPDKIRELTDIGTLTVEEAEQKLSKHFVKGGSTLSFIILFQDVLIVFQIGDSFVCVYDCHGGMCFHTTPHNYTNQQEIDRLEKIGFSFKGRKLERCLEPSRGFGDFQFKKSFPGAYIATPSISIIENIANRSFLILGTDGLTENNLDITNILPSMVSKCLKDPSDILNISRDVSTFASRLCDEALLHKNTDNISAIVVYLKNLDR